MKGSSVLNIDAELATVWCLLCVVASLSNGRGMCHGAEETSSRGSVNRYQARGTLKHSRRSAMEPASPC